MRILIVDDDSLVRIGLKTIVNWEEEGYELVGEACNGIEALEIIRQTAIDILISDIQMDGMDGLELLGEIKKLNQPPAVLILSNYNDFPYVRQALQLGAVDYILKLEARRDTLLQALDKIRMNLEKEKEKQDLHNEFHRYQKRNIMKKNFLRDLLNGFFSGETEILNSMKTLGLHLDRDYVYCVMIKAGNQYRFEEVTEEELYVLNVSVINIVEEIANETGFGYCFEGQTGNFYLLYGSSDPAHSRIDREILGSMARQIINMLELYANAHVRIAVGEGAGGTNAILQSYNLARETINYRFFKGNTDILFYDDVQADCILISEVTYRIEDKHVTSALKNLDAEQLGTSMNQILEIVCHSDIESNQMKNDLVALYFTIGKFFDRLDIKNEDVLKRSCISYTDLIQLRQLGEIAAWLDCLQSDLSDYIKAEKMVAYPAMIRQAQAYIQAHFTEDLTLQEVANEVFISPSYFSMELKRITGQSFKKYLTNLRIQKAKELLDSTDMEIYEIGELVGYKNSYYFDRIFKKETGISPGEYKRNR